MNAQKCNQSELSFIRYQDPSKYTVKSLVNKQSRLDLTVSDSQGAEKLLRFNPHWLRFNCHLCKDKSSGQRTIISDSVPLDLRIKNVKLVDEANVSIEWNDESKQLPSELKLSFLINHHPHETPERERFRPCTEMVFFDYQKFHDSRSGHRNNTEILRWYEHMALNGVSVIRNVGTKESMARHVAEMIGSVQRTIYGEDFDVKVEKAVTNVAQRDVELPLHMDLPYYESPPGLQLLHCIQFDSEIKGGESLLLDSFATLEDFRKLHPSYFEHLAKIPGSWQYLIVGHQKQEVMIRSHPLIRVNHLNQIVGFTWSPNQEAPLRNVSEEKVKDFYESYLCLASFLKKSKNVIEYRLQPGELLVFNNRRFLHGRNSFTSMKGSRHLQVI